MPGRDTRLGPAIERGEYDVSGITVDSSEGDHARGDAGTIGPARTDYRQGWDELRERPKRFADARRAETPRQKLHNLAFPFNRSGR